MRKWNIRVNTLLMERDSNAIRHSLSKIYQSMEILEVMQITLEHCWEGAAKETFFQLLHSEWEQLVLKKKELEQWVGKWEQIQNIYQSCEKRVMREVESLKI